MTPKQLLLTYLSIPDCIILVDSQMGRYIPDRRVIETADADWFYLEWEESSEIKLDSFSEESVTLNREETKFHLREIIEANGGHEEQNIFISVSVKLSFPEEGILKSTKTQS